VKFKLVRLVKSAGKFARTVAQGLAQIAKACVLRALPFVCCPLYIDATQAVVSEGPAPAVVVLVGNNPAIRKIVPGVLFVRPAGRQPRSRLEESDLDRNNLFVTNVVKHFSMNSAEAPPILTASR
jgi:DNA polymerase